MLASWLRRRRARRETALALYGGILRQARAPAFYAELQAPDTIDGRFDLLALHAFLVLRRLRGLGAQATAQAVVDLLFADLDRSLREVGVSDHSIGRRMKDMARAFYGRLAAYEQALGGREALETVLLRNVYREAEARRADAARLAAYTRRAAAALDAQPAEEILAGNLRFAAAQER